MVSAVEQRRSMCMTRSIACDTAHCVWRAQEWTFAAKWNSNTHDTALAQPSAALQQHDQPGAPCVQVAHFLVADLQPWAAALANSLALCAREPP